MCDRTSASRHDTCWCTDVTCMMTSSNGNFFALLALCAGKSPVTGALTFSLICAWTNDWVNNRDASDLRCHRAHYDVTLMKQRHTLTIGFLAHCMSPPWYNLTRPNKMGDILQKIKLTAFSSNIHFHQNSFWLIFILIKMSQIILSSHLGVKYMYYLHTQKLTYIHTACVCKLGNHWYIYVSSSPFY